MLPFIWNHSNDAIDEWQTMNDSSLVHQHLCQSVDKTSRLLWQLFSAYTHRVQNRRFYSKIPFIYFFIMIWDNLYFASSARCSRALHKQILTSANCVCTHYVTFSAHKVLPVQTGKGWRLTFGRIRILSLQHTMLSLSTTRIQIGRLYDKCSN